MTYPTYLFTGFGVPKPETEFYFHPTRKFRFDFAWPAYKIACEIEGGIWRRDSQGRAAGAHSRPQKILGDMERQNEAALLGWRICRFTPQELESGEAANFMRRVLETCSSPL